MLSTPKRHVEISSPLKVKFWNWHSITSAIIYWPKQSQAIQDSVAWKDSLYLLTGNDMHGKEKNSNCGHLRDKLLQELLTIIVFRYDDNIMVMFFLNSPCLLGVHREIFIGEII